MATKQDVIRRVLRTLQIIRAGQDVPGDMYTEVLERFNSYLLGLNEECSLDFDPLADSIPDERVFFLEMAFSQIVSPSYGKPFSEALLERYERKFFASILGESDHIEPEVSNF